MQRPINFENNSYELERNKPVPNYAHGVLQANLIFELKLSYNNKFSIASEVSLDTLPESSTPDIVIYPKRELNFINEQAKQPSPPIVTIEIQSPFQSTDEMVSKLPKYFSFGIKSCWIVFPALKAVIIYEKADTYKFFDQDDLLTDDLVDIQIDLKKIFETA